METFITAHRRSVSVVCEAFQLGCVRCAPDRNAPVMTAAASAPIMEEGSRNMKAGNCILRAEGGLARSLARSVFKYREGDGNEGLLLETPLRDFAGDKVNVFPQDVDETNL